MSQRTAFLERLRRGRQTRERALAVVADLDDPQLSWRTRAKPHTIGYTLWHLACTGDNFQNDVNGRGTVWTNGGFAAKWGYPEKGVGVGWEDERAAARPMPGEERLREGVRAAFRGRGRRGGQPRRTHAQQDAPLVVHGRRRDVGAVPLGSVTHGNRHLGEIGPAPSARRGCAGATIPHAPSGQGRGGIRAGLGGAGRRTPLQRTGRLCRRVPHEVLGLAGAAHDRYGTEDQSSDDGPGDQ